MAGAVYIERGTVTGEASTPGLRRVLDIGVGTGGKYLRRDAERGIARTGVDKSFYALTDCQRRFGAINPNLSLAQLDVYLPKDKMQHGERLPFADEEFDEVNLFFPHHTLLYSLISDTSGLWDEFHRILSVNGSVRVIFDADTPWNERIIRGLSTRLTMKDPNLYMPEAARAAGFNVGVRTVDAEEDMVRELGTRYSEKLVNRSSHNSSTIYELIATKGPVETQTSR